MYLQRHFAPIGHVLITLLKERHGIAKWCGYVLDRSNLAFLQSQNDVVYSKLLLEDDVVAAYKTECIDPAYLSFLEREYGIPNLWPHIMPDRVLRYNLYRRAYPHDTPIYSHEDMMKMVQVTARAVIRFFDEEKPDFIFFSVIGNLSTMLLYTIARKKGIRTFVLEGARIGIKYFLSERYDRSTFVERAQEELRATLAPENPLYMEAEEFLHSFRRKPQYFLEASGGREQIMENFRRSRLRHFSFLLPQGFIRSTRWTLRAIFQYARNPRKDDYIVLNPFHELWDKCLRKARLLRGYGDLYEKPAAGETFAYFALHTEPEAYPMILAPFYTDQLWLVKQVARSLPIACKLYIKDHPVMQGLRRRSYYKELKKLPNVRLIAPGVSGLSLIEKSSLVLTIAGTTGWEAVLLKKPVIVFGPTYYSRLPGVKECRDITTLPYAIKEQLGQSFHDERELLTLIAALLCESVNLDLVHIWDMGGMDARKDRKRLAALADLVARKLGVTKTG